MTDATFQTRQFSPKAAISVPAMPTEFSAPYFRALLNVFFIKRAIDVDSTLAARARRENARRSVDNLLR